MENVASDQSWAERQAAAKEAYWMEYQQSLKGLQSKTPLALKRYKTSSEGVLAILEQAVDLASLTRMRCIAGNDKIDPIQGAGSSIKGGLRRQMWAYCNVMGMEMGCNPEPPIIAKVNVR